MKGNYIKNRPASTKAKGGNPSYYRPNQQGQEAGVCTNLKGEVVENANKFTAKNGKMYKRKTKGAHYVRRLVKQVIKKMNDQLVYGTVSLLETAGGKQFWVAREEEGQWDSDQCVIIDILTGDNLSVEEMTGVKGCWVEVEHIEVCDTVKPTEDAAVNRLAGAFR